MQIGPFDIKLFGYPASVPPAPHPDELPAFLDFFLGRSMAYAYEQYGISDLREAWGTFRVWMSTEPDPGAEDWRLFLFWYVFHWQSPATGPVFSRRDTLVGQKVANAMHEELSEKQKSFLRSAMQSPLDFYEIYRLEDWNCFYAKSLFLGQEGSFSFEKLPSGMGAGDIFFGMIVPLTEDRGVLAAYSRVLDTSAKVQIARLRQDLVGDRKSDFSNNFNLFDSDVFNLYFDLLQAPIARKD